MRTQALWVQEVRTEGRLGYKKVLGSRNPSDALTKYMPGPLLDKHMSTVGLDVRGGRADTAPTLDVIEAYTEGWLNKRVRFHGQIVIVPIPAEGASKKIIRKVKDTQWQAKEIDGDNDEGMQKNEVPKPRGSSDRGW